MTPRRRGCPSNGHLAGSTQWGRSVVRVGSMLASVLEAILSVFDFGQVSQWQATGTPIAETGLKRGPNGPETAVKQASRARSRPRRHPMDRWRWRGSTLPHRCPDSTASVIGRSHRGRRRGCAISRVWMILEGVVTVERWSVSSDVRVRPRRVLSALVSSNNDRRAFRQ